ncbi:fam-b protein [Plasmodium vinckei brucechwatti]|uniref:Fam-b protein n=1 Tax=Plasmodium vinckei brucechwatti TaxID=119398 RepID=A0A6V7T3N1_PLAVN|nr:fam-b protein [Plasmodium vinckei brucechwatti]
MKISILKYASFSIIICFFGFTKNELYFISETRKCLEGNIIKFRNNRVLAYVDDQFDLNDFYQSALSLANQFSDRNDDGDDGEEIEYLRNIIDFHIKKHKENNTLPNLDNVDRKTKKLIYELRKELEEAKKELDNKRNGELSIQPIQDKRIIKKYENNSLSEYEAFKQMENHENILEAEHNHFECVYNHITSNNFYKELKMVKNYKKSSNKLFKKWAMFIVGGVVVVTSGVFYLLILLIPYIFSIIKKSWKIVKLKSEILKVSR